MPSHKIHIKIAQDINKILKLDNDSITLGSVLPDLTIDKDHASSHFQNKDDSLNNFANAYKFVKENNKFDDISIGYIIHLLTDKYYNNWYYNIYKLKGIKCCKELKHKLFESYDKYILKHFKLNKINNYNVIDKIPNYINLEFDKENLKKYIYDYNNEIDKSMIDEKYVINDLETLNEVYNNCINYILNELNIIIVKER